MIICIRLWLLDSCLFGGVIGIRQYLRARAYCLHSIAALVAAAAMFGVAALPAFGNTTGIAATGDPVTVKDNGDGTVTMANGLVSILLETAQNRLNSITYTTNNSGTPRTIETLQKNEHFRWGGTPAFSKSTTRWSVARNRARIPVTLSALPEFLRRGLFAPPWVIFWGGSLAPHLD
jgi:hypothetical protein